MDKSEYRQISRLLLQTVASEYWTRVIGFDPLVDPSQFELKRHENEKKGTYKKRLHAVLHSKVIRNEARLRQLLSERLTHTHRKEHANALVHSVRLIAQRCDEEVLVKIVKSNPRLTPSIGMLKRLGKVPDFAIREYKDLFFPSEWRLITQSQIYKTEDDLRKTFQQSLEFDKVSDLLAKFDAFHVRVKEDRLSRAILEKKKDRLTKASLWKKEVGGDTVKPLDMARRRYREENVKSAFSPVDIFVAADEKGAAEIDSQICYDPENRSFYLREQIAANSSEMVRAVSNEIIAWLNTK